MTRRFLRPLFQFWEPFNVDQYVSKKSIPGGSKALKDYYGKGRKSQQNIDANETFDNFFKDYYENTNSLRQQEKQFFQKHYPERVGKKFNPYESLGIEKSSDLEKIKQAYRLNALKYHPKIDNSAEAQRRFSQIARAYNELLHEKRRDDNGEDVSTKSLFEDFHQKLEEFDTQEQNKQEINQDMNSKKENKNEKQQGNKSNMSSFSQTAKKEQNLKQGAQKKQEKSGDSKSIPKGQEKKESQSLKGAELYSESSYYEFINGQRKLHVTKLYEKDGKKLRVDRIEGQLPDGSIEVSETFDDGTEIKNKKYVHGSKKHKQIGK